MKGLVGEVELGPKFELKASVQMEKKLPEKSIVIFPIARKKCFFISQRVCRPDSIEPISSRTYEATIRLPIENPRRAFLTAVKNKSLRNGLTNLDIQRTRRKESH